MICSFLSVFIHLYLKDVNILFWPAKIWMRLKGQKSLGKGKQVESEQPASSIEEFSEWESKFGLCAGTVQYLDNQQSLFHLESSPNFPHAIASNEHGVLLIEFFIAEDALPIHNHQTFLPFAQDLRLLVDFSKVETVFGESLRYSRQAGSSARV
jgi:hypothetical protein